ncbi:hypothetical protein QYM36_012794 [Artemia franciscana]|uniref:Uncharacterized protein n=1 Tax=Artemia franciscana TaxID=6661 RepID=A0AA88HR24_ARTSF|nr:hypothetical protein QYM36_012794 [Artemia franciscana]
MKVNFFKLKVCFLHAIAATCALAGFYLTPLAFDLYYNLVYFRLRQTEYSLTPSKLWILVYLALLATESVVLAIAIWLTPNNNSDLRPTKRTSFWQIFLTASIFVLCIASIILICLKKLSIIWTAIVILILITIVSLLLITFFCRIFSQECSEYSEAIKPGLLTHKNQSPNESQENLAQSEKRNSCTGKIIQWFENFFVGDLNTSSWYSWDFIILCTNFIFTVYQSYLLIDTLESFMFPDDDDEYLNYSQTNSEILGLSTYYIGVVFLIFYSLESLCYCCHKLAEYIASSRTPNTTSFSSRRFWSIFDWFTQCRYKNPSSITVMPRPIWIKAIVLVLGLISPVLAQMIDHAFMLVTMKHRSNSRDDRKPTELEETEFARNDTEFNRLQNNLVFSGIILGVADLLVLFSTDKLSVRHQVEERINKKVRYGEILLADKEKWVDDIMNSLNKEKIKDLIEFIVLTFIAIFNSPLTANGYGLAMRAWLGIKDPITDPNIKIFFLKFLEHFFIHNCKMFSLFFLLYTLSPQEYCNYETKLYDECVINTYVYKPEAMIVILIYFTAVHLINGIHLDRTWVDLWEQFTVISGSKELKKHEPKLGKTGLSHGFNASDRLKNLCYPVCLAVYFPIALINAVYRAIFFEPFYNSPATIVFYHSTMFSVIVVGISIGMSFVPPVVHPNANAFFYLFLSGSIIGILVAIAYFWVSPIIHNDVNFSPNEQKRKANEYWEQLMDSSK